jgi:hypothetical protein
VASEIQQWMAEPRATFEAAVRTQMEHKNASVKEFKG